MVTGQIIFLFLVTTISWLAPGHSLPRRRAEKTGLPLKCDEIHDELYCGSDDFTYLNMCEFEAAIAKDRTLTIVSKGACPCDYKDSHEWDPICAENGQSYANNCELEKARKIEPGLHIRHLGLCNSLLKRDTITYRELQKVKLWSSFMPKKLLVSLSSRDLVGGVHRPKKRHDTKDNKGPTTLIFGKRNNRTSWIS